MKAALLSAALAATLASGATREALGVHGGWGAFRDADPPRCYAIARSLGGGGTASVATWPARRLRGSLSLRLGRAADRSAPVTLSIGERRFVLAARDRDAFAADGDADRAIVAAMRSGRSMSVEGVGAGGVPFADSYALAGAATAIDAAALACAGQ